MFARIMSTVNGVGQKIGFGAGWVAGFTAAAGKSAVEKTGEVAKTTTALTIKTFNRVSAVTTDATQSAGRKTAETAKTIWRVVNDIASQVIDVACRTWERVGSFCLTRIEPAFVSMLVGAALLLAVSSPAFAAVVGLALYYTGCVIMALGLLYLAFTVLPRAVSPAPSVA